MTQKTLCVQTKGKGLYAITEDVLREAGPLPSVGLMNLFVRHTSASLLIQENYDPTARKDLETFLEKLIPENQNWHSHTVEGPDDTTSHLKSAITAVTLTIPITDGHLALGRWQGIYLWEHRQSSHNREIVITVS